jgi:hypothetical protein
MLDAGKYLMAFEYQLFKGNLFDTPDYQERLFDDAALEFFHQLASYVSNPKEEIDPTSTDNRTQSFLAISAVLEQTLAGSNVIAAQKGSETTSMYTLIRDALRKSQGVESGKVSYNQLKSHEAEILNNQDMALELLKARANILPLIVVSRITNIEQRSFFGKAWMIYKGSDASFDGLTVPALVETVSFMNKANETVKLLRDLRVPFEPHSRVKKLYAHMNLPQPGQGESSKRLPPDQRGARDALEAELVSGIQDYMKGPEAESVAK